ncbi:MAG: hypothetical protein ACLQVD_22655 [Capsulimonadaceae bacterium]
MGGSNRDHASILENCPGWSTSPVSAIGNFDLMQRRRVGVACSIACPGDVILKALDLASVMRNADASFAGGFHSPMEREVLDILLRGTCGVILCPARQIDGMRIPAELRAPLDAGRLMILSPFSEGQRRMTATIADTRNRFVASISDVVLVMHGSAGGGTEALVTELLAQGKILYTVDSPHNQALVNLGVRVVREGGREIMECDV